METLSDIVAEMRTRSREVKEAFGGRPDGVENMLDIWADRIEAIDSADAWRSLYTPPVGNAAALRDAVIRALTLLNVCDWPPGVSLYGVGEVIREIDSVLDKPPRQCDVGTAEEKYQRWVHFCEQRLHSCHNCECKSPVGCTFKFGDMPYEAEEGAADENSK